VKLPRFGIGGLMMLSMVVAADIAAGRAIVSHESYLAERWLVATMPMAIVLQCAVVWVRSGGGRSRTFWISALIAGTLALGSVVWDLADPPSETITFSKTGKSTEIYPGGLAARIWGPYQSTVYEGLESIGLLADHANGLAQNAIDGFVRFVPQVLVALTAGLIAEKIRRRLRRPAGVSPFEDRIPKSLKQVASIAAVLVIAMIVGGGPALRDCMYPKVSEDLPVLQPIVDDLKFLEVVEDAKPAPP
jgi:hypothetical protein